MPGLQYYQWSSAVLLNASQMRGLITWEDRDISVSPNNRRHLSSHLFFALLAGLLSFLSPCVLPLVPAYVFYLAGWTLSKTLPDEPLL